MKEFTLYHNPRCSKSREALALLEQHKITPRVVLYLETPLNKTTLKKLLKQLALNARDILRSNEDIYKELKLQQANLSDDAILQAITEHPKLLQRPIVSNGERAVIGRPPSDIIGLL